MDVFQLAEKEDVDVEIVFRFARFHFGQPSDNEGEEDYSAFLKGEPLPKYVKEMLLHPTKKGCH